ncbi:unnamed protein product [Cylicocyclus nassatus]|uniref:Histone deacetylase domain-containing protein n=1 Tax=Cylicocyclus nassatus TaxID=53992 RepID=A0AA36GT29_CYLNA|nr:unnamed protein product [Cylicocyclus nassatus]
MPKDFEKVRQYVLFEPRLLTFELVASSDQIFWRLKQRRSPRSVLLHRSVMAVSFLKYGSLFFPETGSIYDQGLGARRYFAVNVPLQQGIDDDVFRLIIGQLVESFQPEAIVLQCGADSLGFDRLHNNASERTANIVYTIK